MSIVPLEGSDDGLLLRLAWQTSPSARRLPAASNTKLRLVIERSIDGASARTIRSHSLDARLLDVLAGGELHVRDNGLNTAGDSARTTLYRATLLEQTSGEWSHVARSPTVRLRWPPAPPLPGQPTLDAVTDSSVDLTWAPDGFATRVLRRDVLRESDEPTPLATLPASDDPQTRFTDRNVKPGDVFAYQIAYGTPLEVSIGTDDQKSRPRERTMRWGPVSEALYVSVK